MEFESFHRVARIVVHHEEPRYREHYHAESDRVSVCFFHERLPSRQDYVVLSHHKICLLHSALLGMSNVTLTSSFRLQMQSIIVRIFCI